jgi:hypothetical protein
MAHDADVIRSRRDRDAVRRVVRRDEWAVALQAVLAHAVTIRQHGIVVSVRNRDARQKPCWQCLPVRVYTKISGTCEHVRGLCRKGDRQAPCHGQRRTQTSVDVSG